MASITRWPGRSRSIPAAGRCAARRSIEHLLEQGACFGEKLGWERPNWFAGPARSRRPLQLRPAELVRGGRRASTRPAASASPLFDQTSFAKFLLVGKDAEAALSWLCANDVAKPPGSLTYTQLLNARGGIECDLTVARLAQDRFYLVTGTGFATHDFDWIARHIPAGLDADLVDGTIAHAVLSLFGPQARDVLGALRRTISATTLPVRHLAAAAGRWRPGHGAARDLCRRAGLGAARPGRVRGHGLRGADGGGRPHGIANAGYRAIESLRLEKGYRAWGADIGPDHSPLVAGLGWAVKLKQDTPFLGREALLEQRSKPLPRLLAGFTADDPEVVLLGRETIYRDGVRVGWLGSAGYGYTRRQEHRLRLCPRPGRGRRATTSWPAATSWRSRASACRRRCSWGRSTIPRPSGCAPERQPMPWRAMRWVIRAAASSGSRSSAARSARRKMSA